MQVREAMRQISFENERRFYRFEPDGGFELASLMTNGIDTYGACVDTTQDQLFIDELNATTGLRIVIPPAVRPNEFSVWRVSQLDHILADALACHEPQFRQSFDEEWPSAPEHNGTQEDVIFVNEPRFR